MKENKIKEARELASIQHKYKEAIDLLETVLIDDPSDIDALILKGNILELNACRIAANSTSGEYSEVQELKKQSKKCYEKVLEIDPDNPVVLKDMGDYWEDNNQNQKALEFYNKAISLLKEGKIYKSAESELEETFWAKYELLRKEGDDEEAKKCLEEGRKLCPESTLLN